ncbi:hypothetical protein [Nocardioides caldifontis]|uniref:hypothetical protein n=1 Tax=Nocardioides caldifontis TaxID=2588938 RepID=UPI0011DFA9BC|nr:hypothetical protein [Nocardioides caldifontis]
MAVFAPTFVCEYESSAGVTSSRAIAVATTVPGEALVLVAAAGAASGVSFGVSDSNGHTWTGLTQVDQSSGRLYRSAMIGGLRVTIVAAACVALTTSGCIATGEVDGNEPPIREPVEVNPAREARHRVPKIKMSSLWTCTYSPTYDNDWHNDVVCTDGTRSERPYLRAWDSYVTPDEIMESAREYEAELNATYGAFGTPHRRKSKGRSESTSILCGPELRDYLKSEGLWESYCG